MDERAFFQEIQSGGAFGAYLLYGEEPYSRAQAILQAEACIDEAARTLNVQRLKNPEPHEVINACETLPFFAERRLVCASELSADCATALAAYVEKTPETTLLLLLYAGKPNAQSALLKTLSKADRAVEFERFSPERAVAFLEKRAAAQGASIDRLAARQLVERAGVDLALLESTLARLIDYAGVGARVTVAAVEACVPPSVEANVFAILDALMAGNRRAAVTGLTELIRSGADTPMRLASFFEGRIKQMLIAKQLLHAGQSEQSAIKALGGSPYAAKKTVQNAKKCSTQRLTDALEAFASVDWQQKQGTRRDDDALLLAFYSLL